MNYIKKMCILRQVKQGFSGDGKTLSGLVKAEQYGKNLAVEVSVINFAPLAMGEYYCLLSDGKGKTEMLSLRGKSVFNLLSDMDISGGFCAVLCYVKNEVVPIAYGINGKGAYDWRSILNKALPPVFPKKQGRNEEIAGGEQEISEKPLENEGGRVALNEQSPKPEALPPTPEQEGYDDERVATENYYEEKNDERKLPSKAENDAGAQTPTQNEGEKERAATAAHADAENVLRPFAKAPDGYYLSVKRELDELFANYPEDRTLCGAFRHSEWVRLRGEANAPEYLVGALYEDGKVRYICYALKAENRNAPPEEIREVCSFVPAAPWPDAEGFFVIFQSASTGECVKPPRA